jgi:hypothetical protein
MSNNNNNNNNTTNATSDSICVLIDKYSKLKDNESNNSITSTNTTVKNLSNQTINHIDSYISAHKTQALEDIKFLNELIEGHIDQSKKKPKINSENHKLKEIVEQLSISFTNKKNQKILINIFFNETSKISFMARFCNESTLTKEQQHKDINKKFKDMIERIKKFEMYINNFIAKYNSCSISDKCKKFITQIKLIKLNATTIKGLIVLLNNLTSEKFVKFENFDNLIIKVIDS